jgi:hypothetical protein
LPSPSRASAIESKNAFEELFRRDRGEEVHRAGDHSGPSGLVAGAETRTVVPVEVFVELDAIAPVRILALGTSFVRGDFNARSTVANTAEWGTMRYSALDLIQDALNLKTPTVLANDS